MPLVSFNQTRPHTSFSLDVDVKNKASGVVNNLITVSNSASALISGEVKSEPGKKLSFSTLVGVSDQLVPILFINKHTAKAVLSELVKQPKSESTYATRLACLKADHSIPTWQALTHNPEELKVLEQTHLSKFEERLAEVGVWLPEVESINTNILMNLTAKVADQYAASFQSLLLDSGAAEIKDVSIVRGPPASGKTSFLNGGFSLSADDIKNYLQNRMPGLTMSQVHLQGSMLLDRFMNSMEVKFEQSFTRDGLYLNPRIIEQKLQAVGLLEGRQKAAVHDIQVDLTTLCCRMLKRSTDEALLGFDYLSRAFRFSLENRQETIELVQKEHGVISEYSLSAWDGSKNVKVAERSAGSKDITIYDQALFDLHVTRDAVLIDAEIARVRDTVIEETFIYGFTAGFEPTIAAIFAEALSKYDGITIAQALELHLDRDHVATSVASRVIAGAVSA